MSAARQAYEAARQEIAEKRAGDEVLVDLSLDRFAALEALPAEIARFTELEELFLGGTRVGELTLLAGLVRLKCLDLEDTPVRDFTPLAGLGALERLFLDDTRIADLGPLAGLGALEWLFLACTPVSDLTPLAGLTRLRRLDLYATKVRDAGPLSGLVELRMVSLGHTEIADLAPLRGLKELARAPEAGGLEFRHAAAAPPGSRLAEIAEITDPARRARALFRHLDAGPPATEN